MPDANQQSDRSTAAPSCRAAWRWAKRIAVFAFVVWHLFMLLVGNTKIEGEWLDDSVRKYESYSGVDQAWGMFTSPLWRKNEFPAVRIEFNDGSTALVPSRNEPSDVTEFIRTGAPRLRKFEQFIAAGPRGDGDYRYPMWRQYARWCAQRWRDANPDDSRRPLRAELVKRIYQIPGPGEPRDTIAEFTEKTILTVELEAGE